MEKKYYTKQEILESRELLTEDMIENILMVAGFVPVIGTIADIILIIRYLMKGEKLYAALMLIGLIPMVGNAIVNPMIKLLRGAGEVGTIAFKSEAAALAFAKSHPQFAAKYIQMGEHLASPLVTKTINQIEKIPLKGETWANGLREAIGEHSSVISKLRPVRLAKSVGAEIAAGGKFSTGIKNFFQEEKLAQYITKHGEAPSTWLSNWYNVVYKGQAARRGMVKKFIASNKILNILGLPNLEAFETKMETDKNFREKIASDPQFSQMVNQTTTSEDLEKIQKDQTQKSGGGLGGFMGLGMLKMMAQGL
jgi:hypothetical protein